jgi:hypothetical protein
VEEVFAERWIQVFKFKPDGNDLVSKDPKMFSFFPKSTHVPGSWGLTL